MSAEQPSLAEKFKINKPGKVLFINPQSEQFPENGSRFPNGLFCLASSAAKRYPSIQYRILDLQIENSDFDIEGFLKVEQPDLTMITAVTPYITSAKNIGSIHKNILPEKISWVGGYHTTVMPKDALSDGAFDFGAVGEGEETFLELMDSWVRNQSVDVTRIKGLVYVDPKGELQRTGIRRASQSLDSYPYAANARKFLVGNGKYKTFGGIKRFDTSPGSILTQRGCQNNCKFCGSRRMYPLGLRQRSPENVVGEMEVLKKEYGIQNFYILDDTFNNNPERVDQICKLIIKRRLNIEWVAMGRTDTLNVSMYNQMKRAGCSEIALGVESLDPAVRQGMGKESNVDDVVEVTRLIKNSGIEVKWYLMVGSPSPENFHSSELTAKGLEKIKPDKIRVFKTIPYPGSTYYNNKTLHVLPEYTGRWEHYWANNMPSDPFGNLTGITYTDNMDVHDIEKARQLLISTHLSYGGAI